MLFDLTMIYKKYILIIMASNLTEMCHLPIFSRPAFAELCLGAPPAPGLIEGEAGLKLSLAHISSDISTCVLRPLSKVNVCVKSQSGIGKAQ